MRFPILALAAAVVVACAKTSAHPADSAAQKVRSAADTGMPMHGMPARAVGSGAMVEQMRMHLQTMQAMKADGMRAQMPMHRQMADSMIAQMASDMANMKMPADPRWSALMDSVRQDLTRMPGMDGAELEKTMAAHHSRLIRLMEMHQKMMAPKK